MVYKTDSDGELISSDQTYLVSGTPYRDIAENISWPIGTVVIRETKAPKGYKIPDIAYVVTIRLNAEGNKAVRTVYDKNGNRVENNGTISVGNTLIEFSTLEPAIYGGVRGSKIILQTRDKTVGNADVSNIRFVVVSDNKNDVIIDTNRDRIKDKNSERYGNGKVVGIFKTDADGNFSSSADYLAAGNYTLYELRKDAVVNIGDTYATANLGTSLYASPRNDVVWKENRIPFTISKDKQIVSADNTTDRNGNKAIGNDDSRGKIAIVKQDSDNVLNQGDASIAGIKYAIINRSKAKVKYKNVEYAPNKIIDILTTDANGHAATADRSLDYGTYQVVELRVDNKATIGATWNDTMIGTI